MDVRRPGFWTSATAVAGRPPPRGLDVRRPEWLVVRRLGDWTFADPAAGRPPPRVLDVCRPGVWTSSAPGAGRPPPGRLDVWTSAARRLDVRRPENVCG